ncbi:hypothetical protein HRW13_13215 [Streptomyces lunaelactis]|uniref:hypothetical protein n=1 Tax=Streptomyces lunaelactis TaxID=1535768 RepID=UPI001585C8F9|nr:hypothetical protein [Streptomyces lunaelactis]NUK41824.1 hypothetical protein [Streptomyces lunaelactis]
MIEPDDKIAFIAPECGALSLLLRIGDVVVAGFFSPILSEPMGEAVSTFDLPTYAERETAAKERINELAIAHILDGWDLIGV